MKTFRETGTDMRQRACTTATTLLILALAVPSAATNYFLYSPETVTPDEKGLEKEGVLVREVEIRKGDTLSGISRRFSGRGYYYPQILLFNNIKNPNLIYSGATLKVPLPRGKTVASPAVASPADTTPQRRAESKPPAQTKESKSGRKLFNRALAAYRRGNFSAALALFDRFLTENPSSPKAADASLYKADCYLKLSTK